MPVLGAEAYSYQRARKILSAFYVEEANTNRQRTKAVYDSLQPPAGHEQSCFVSSIAAIEVRSYVQYVLYYTVPSWALSLRIFLSWRSKQDETA